jgi:hypothetical protein
MLGAEALHMASAGLADALDLRARVLSALRARMRVCPPVS